MAASDLVKSGLDLSFSSGWLWIISSLEFPSWLHVYRSIYQFERHKLWARLILRWGALAIIALRTLFGRSPLAPAKYCFEIRLVHPSFGVVLLCSSVHTVHVEDKRYRVRSLFVLRSISVCLLQNLTIEKRTTSSRLEVNVAFDHVDVSTEHEPTIYCMVRCRSANVSSSPTARIKPD